MILALTLVLSAAAPPETLIVPLREVVVTGSRTSETLLGVPAAVSVVSRESFADSRGIGLQDALGNVPGVFAQSRGGGQDARFTIRGFGARGNGDRSNAGNIRGIRVVLDGMPLSEPDGRSSLDLVDLGSVDRVEVLRSNGSALYGNASGGVINLRSALDFDRPYAELRQRAAAYGYHREQLVAGFRMGATRASLSVLNSTFDGWRRHSQSSSTQAQLRLTVPLDPDTRLGVMLDGASNINRFPGALTLAELAADPTQADPGYVTRDERRRNRVGRMGLTLDHAFDAAQTMDLKVYVEPKVLQRSERGRFRDFNRYHVGGSALYQRRAALRPDLLGRLSVGGDEAWQDGSILFYSLAGDGSRGTTQLADKREGANSAGGFVEGELRWRERWAVRLAARYDALRYISEDHQDPTINAEKTFIRWTPKATLSWLAGDHTVYAALGGGVEAPAFNEVDPPPNLGGTSLNPLLDATHSTTYELGGRGQLALGDRLGLLRYDAALYWIEVADDFVPFAGGAYFQTIGRTRRQGAELGLDWLPASGVLLESALTLSRNRYREYDTGAQDFAGNAASGLPEKTFHGTARFGPWKGWGAELGLDAVDGYYADDQNTARTQPYALLNATASYSRDTGMGALRAFVSGLNLADEDYVASVFINGVSGRFYEPGLPRNWAAGLTLRWD